MFEYSSRIDRRMFLGGTSAAFASVFLNPTRAFGVDPYTVVGAIASAAMSMNAQAEMKALVESGMDLSKEAIAMTKLLQKRIIAKLDDLELRQNSSDTRAIALRFTELDLTQAAQVAELENLKTESAKITERLMESDLAAPGLMAFTLAANVRLSLYRTQATNGAINENIFKAEVKKFIDHTEATIPKVITLIEKRATGASSSWTGDNNKTQGSYSFDGMPRRKSRDGNRREDVTTALGKMRRAEIMGEVIEAQRESLRLVVASLDIWRRGLGLPEYHRYWDKEVSGFSGFVTTNNVNDLDQLCVIENGYLWMVSPTTGERSQKRRAWPQGARAVLQHNGDLYVVYDGRLWQVSVDTGMPRELGDRSWTNARHS